MQTRAARLHKPGEALVVQDVTLRAAGPEEVLVAMYRAAVNPLDGHIASGAVGAGGSLPRILGVEGAGVVDDTAVLVYGQGLGLTRDGAFTGHALVPRLSVMPVPDGVSLPQAACVGVAGLTAYSVVETLAQVTADDRVLVLGASGGVGLSVVSLAASRGANVWGQTTAQDKADVICDVGAVEALVADAGQLAELAADVRPTVIIDALGGEYTSAALGLLQQGGRYVVFGVSAGAHANLDLQLLYRRGIHLLGYSGFDLGPAELRARLGLALAAVAEKTLVITVGLTVSINDVAAGFEALADRAIIGKVLLDVEN